MKHLSNNVCIKMILIFMLAVLGGCSSVGQYESEGDSIGVTNLSVDMGRQIIKSASIKIEVKEPEVTSNEIDKITKSISGFIESCYSYDEKSFNLAVKVPVAKLESYVDQVAEMGTLISRTMNSENVTKDIVDIDARLKNLYSLRERYRQLLEKANNLVEMLKVEEQLTRIQTEIDMIHGRRKSLVFQSSFSRVDIRIERTVIYGPITYGVKSIYWLFEKLFIIN
mgnify:CR=1 FL=1